jgi:C-terminal processing protease CtpA/Prc
MDPYPPRSDSLSFEGRVFALIDRFSYSNAAAVASILQDYDFATLIGEETSFNPSNCGGTHTFDLPHTQIEVVYPKMCGVRPSGDTSPHGVIPDYEVKQDYFTEEDEILQAALRIIRESESDSGRSPGGDR